MVNFNNQSNYEFFTFDGDPDTWVRLYSPFDTAFKITGLDENSVPVVEFCEGLDKPEDFDRIMMPLMFEIYEITGAIYAKDLNESPRMTPEMYINQ